jgi:hypothetical protein
VIVGAPTPSAAALIAPPLTRNSLGCGGFHFPLDTLIELFFDVCGELHAKNCHLCH